MPGVSHNKGHGGGSGDQEQDDTGSFGGIQQDLQEALERDALVDDGEDQTVQNCDASALGSGEDTGNDTADNDDDEQQRGHSVPNGLADALALIITGSFHACLFGADKGNQHAAQAHQDAGNVTSHEQGGDGNTASNGGVNNECGGGRDQQAGGGGSNVGCCRVSGVIAVFFLNGADATAHGGSSSNGGTGQCAEQHVAQDVGLCHGAGDLANEQLGKVDQALGNTAVVHDVASQDEEGHSQQRERLNAGVHLLHGDKGDLVPRQGGHGGYNGRNHDADGDGHAQNSSTPNTAKRITVVSVMLIVLCPP